MPYYIVKLEDKYCEWSTIVDAPISYFLNLKDFKQYYKEKYGSHGMGEVTERLKRADRKGTSSLIHESAEDVVQSNRAGKNETHIEIPELLKQYKWKGYK